METLDTSDNELTAADLDRAAAIVRGHVVLVPDLTEHRVKNYYALANRLNTAANVIRNQQEQTLTSQE